MSMPTPGHRSGLTWMEVIVALAAIVLLAALVMPALHTGPHASSRKSQCQDHLHNIAIALHDYELRHKVFPPGWVEQVPAGTNWGWAAQILPYIEQKPLYDAIGVDGPQSLAESLALPSASAKLHLADIDVDRCPSDQHAPLPNAARPLIDAAGRRCEVALANYVAAFRSEWTPTTPDRPGGVFGRNSSTRFAEIMDGTSSTILLGERVWQIPAERTWYYRTVRPQAQCDAAIYYGAGGDGTETFWSDTLATGQSGINSRGLDSTGIPSCRTGFSSAHVGGTQVAWVDAKVSFLSESIAPQVLDALLGKADGKLVRVP